MPNKLTTLLALHPSQRTVDVYEQTFDDYVAFAGGSRIDELFDVPEGVLNADYLLTGPPINVVVELKQVNQHERGRTVDRYFGRLLRRGEAKSFNRLSSTRVQFEPGSLTEHQWNRFYRDFRPGVSRHLDKAAKQLKATAGFLPKNSPRRAYGVILVNTGDFNLPVDLMHRLVEFHTKKKWKAERYSHVDFVICLMMDIIKEGQHPLQGRCLVRRSNDDELMGVVWHLYDRWIRYGAAAIGAEVDYQPNGGSVEDARLDVSDGVTGKILIER